MPMKILVCDSPEEMARHVANHWCRLVEEKHGRFVVALSGGNTARLLYSLLAGSPYREQMPWDSLECFFGDERAVSADHADSNFGMFRQCLQHQVNVLAHPMPAETGDARIYEELVLQRMAAQHLDMPALDLVLLGLGKDGHTASLFPGTSALLERRKLVVMNEVPQLHTRRMTFTYPLINAAKHIWVLAAGPDKQDIVRRCLAARIQPGAQAQYPVLGVSPERGELVWWLDRDAASGIGITEDLDIQTLSK
jgi:6-phosphogluconolactonase